MTNSPSPMLSTDPAPPDPRAERVQGCACCGTAAAERAERQLRMLQDLAEIGMRLARTVDEEVSALAAGKPATRSAGELALEFSRIARTVRQTVALEAKLAAEWREHEVAAAAERYRRRKQRVTSLVRQAIRRESGGPCSIFEQKHELSERLDDLDETDFADRPIAEIVARLCRELGVKFDRRLWEDEGEVRDRPRATTGGRRPPPPRPRSGPGSDPPPTPGPLAAPVGRRGSG